MAIETITYTSLLELREMPQFETLRSFPHIVATNDMAAAMRRRYPEISSITSISDVQKAVLPRWKDVRDQFQKYVILGDIIRTISDTIEDEDLCRTFRKNRRSVLNSIELLTEADVTPSDLVPADPEQSFFRKVWEAYEEAVSEICISRTELWSMEADPRIFLSLLSRSIDGFDAGTVVLYGFFYITPLQQRFIDMFDAAGKDIIYMCCLDPALVNVQSRWEMTLKPEWGFPAREERKVGEAGLTRSRAFGLLFDGKKPEGKERYSNVKVIKYKSDLDLIDDLPRIRGEGKILFSPDKKGLEDILKIYFPEEMGERHFLSYPLGKYIYDLHSMWDRTDQALMPDYETVRSCFSSGWLEAEGENARDHLEALEQISVYVEQCRTPEDWTESLERLIEAKRTLTEAFEAHLDHVPSKNRHVHRIMADPFLDLGSFSVEIEELEKIAALVKKLIRLGEDLFSTSSEINIERHFARLRSIVQARKDDEGMSEEEKAVTKDLLDRLTLGDLAIRTCMPEDITEAVMLIVGSGFMDDTYETEESENSLVHRMMELDSTILKGNRGVHLCMADENRLPGKCSSFPWPLSDEMLLRIESGMEGRRKLYVTEMREIISGGPLSNRYLFYSMLQDRDVEISWIEKEGDKIIGPSPYIRLLRAVFDPVYIEYDRAQEYKADAAGAKDEGPVMVTRPSYDLLSEERYDLALCGWRYLYGHILKDHPSYKDRFQSDFVVSALISAFSSRNPSTKETIAKELFALLPYYREVEKEQLIDYAYVDDGTATDTLDDYSYPKIRMRPHLLTREMISLAESAMEQTDERLAQGRQPIGAFASKSMKVCMFCPFKDECPHAVRTESEQE